MQGRTVYEFRTTVAPELTDEDILKIAERIKGAKLYILQQFRQQGLDRELVDYRMLKTPHSADFVRELSERAGAMVNSYRIRGIV